MADGECSFFTSLAAAETEAAAADLWRVAVEKGVMYLEAIPQHVGTLRGAADYLWMTQGAQAVKGQQDQAAAEWDTRAGILPESAGTTAGCPGSFSAMQEASAAHRQHACEAAG